MRLVSGHGNGRLVRWLATAAAIGASVTLTAACGSSASSGSAGQDSTAAAVSLIPASGPTSSTPTWSTSEACPSGYQGSGLFSEYASDGTYDTIAPVVNGTNSPFKGTLQGTIAQIKALGNIPNGGTQELFVICSSEQAGTGKTLSVMKVYVKYSADGKSYTTSSTR